MVGGLVNEVVAGPFIYDDILGDGDTVIFQGVQLRIQINTAKRGSSTIWGNKRYKPNKGYVCQGRLGEWRIWNLCDSVGKYVRSYIWMSQLKQSPVRWPVMMQPNLRDQQLVIVIKLIEAIQTQSMTFQPDSHQEAFRWEEYDDNPVLSRTNRSRGRVCSLENPTFHWCWCWSRLSLFGNSIHVCSNGGCKWSRSWAKKYTDLLGQKGWLGSKGLFTPLWSKMCC